MSVHPPGIAPAGRRRLTLSGVAKTFTLHLQGGRTLPVVRDVTFTVDAGECVVLGGASGAGKSTILKMIYGTYHIDAGSVLVHTGDDGPAAMTDPATDPTIDMATADPRTIIALRRRTLGYVGQFLRVIPRVSARDVVTEAAREADTDLTPAAAADRASALLDRLRLPARLHDLPPATFSGGEQARVNIARGLAAWRPILLVDEPTASLDAENRAIVETLLTERRQAGVAIVAVFHDEATRTRVATRTVDVRRFAALPLTADVA